MNYDDKVRAAQKLHERVRQFRGRYLNSVAVLETQVAKILAGYFCSPGPRRDLFLSEVATGPTMPLQRKLRIFKQLLRRDFQFFLDGCPGFLPDLERVRELRNRLAHATVDVSDSALKETDKMAFVFFKEGERQVYALSATEAEEAQVQLNTVLSNVEDVRRLIFGMHDPWST